MSSSTSSSDIPHRSRRRIRGSYYDEKRVINLEKLQAEGVEYWDTPLPGESLQAYQAYTFYRLTRSYNEASKRTGVSLSLISRWAMRYRWTERYEAWVQHRANEVMKLFYQSLQTLTLKAVEVLANGMADKTAPLRDRRACAVDVLRLAGVYKETTTVQAQIVQDPKQTLNNLLEEIRARAQLESYDVPSFECSAGRGQETSSDME